MTSNIGSAGILARAEAGEAWEKAEAEVETALRGRFKPEFLNRVDEILVFRPLRRAHLDAIVELQLERVVRMLAEREIRMEVTPAARRRIAETGYDPAFGARPLKRAIQRLIANPLALAFLEGRFAEGDAVGIDVDPAGEALLVRSIDAPAADPRSEEVE